LLAGLPLFAEGWFTMSKPARRVPDIGSSGRAQPGIRQVVLVNALAGLAYTVLVIFAAERPESFLGAIIQRWVAFTGRLVDLALLFAPSPDPSANSVLEVRIADYRHLLVACALITIWSVLSSRMYWPHWARHLSARLGAEPGVRRPANFLLVSAYRTTILGIIAVALVMLFGEPRGERATTFLYTSDWFFLRAPALTTIACVFACRAAALWHCLMHEP
jgi:hypothetical protein